MKHTPEDGADQDKDPGPTLNADRILEIIKDIGEHERHFNTLTGTYKAMASTWLLAVFGGIGFVLVNKIEPWLLFVAGVGLAGSVGILLLWIIDLRVYQQLLNAAFTEGFKLENQYEWLPRVRNNMVSSIRHGSVTVNICWFYILGVGAPLLIFNFSLGAYLLIHLGLTTSILFVLVSGTIFFYLLYTIRFNSKESSIQRERKKVDDPAIRREKGIIFSTGVPLYVMLYVMMYWAVDVPKNDERYPRGISLKRQYDYLAPDGSEIRLLSSGNHGSVAHCILPPARVSRAVEHKTVEEIWYVLEGSGEIWWKNERESNTIKLLPGTSIRIPVHTQFQFRNAGSDSLKILILTMPPWPGADEAIVVNGHWEVSNAVDVKRQPGQ